jgi:hypothetical protein
MGWLGRVESRGKVVWWGGIVGHGEVVWCFEVVLAVGRDSTGAGFDSRGGALYWDVAFVDSAEAEFRPNEFQLEFHHLNISRHETSRDIT